jgi:hypothetical protein
LTIEEKYAKSAEKVKLLENQLGKKKKNSFKILARKKTICCFWGRIDIQVNQTKEVAASRDEFKAEFVKCQEKLSETKEDQIAIVSEMARQYKIMQEELLGKINRLESEVSDLKEQLGKFEFQTELTHASLCYFQKKKKN